MMDILMSETCWAHKKWNKITSDIKLVFHSSTWFLILHFVVLVRYCKPVLSCLSFTKHVGFSPNPADMYLGAVWFECKRLFWVLSSFEKIRRGQTLRLPHSHYISHSFHLTIHRITSSCPIQPTLPAASRPRIGRYAIRILGSVKFFVPQQQHQPCGPPNFPFSKHRVSFQWLKLTSVFSASQLHFF